MLMPLRGLFPPDRFIVFFGPVRRSPTLGNLSSRFYASSWLRLTLVLRLSCWTLETGKGIADIVNKEVEVSQALQCAVTAVGLVLIFPEDVKVHCLHGSTSIWTLKEIQLLEATCEARRGAGFLCHLAEADVRHPLDILSNLSFLHDRLYMEWARLVHRDNCIVKKRTTCSLCPCLVGHTPQMTLLGTKCWKLCNLALLEFWGRFFFFF